MKSTKEHTPLQSRIRNAGFLLTLIIGLMIPMQGIAQEENSRLERVQDWTVLTEEKGVKIEYKFSDCHFESDGFHQQWVLLKFTNTTGDPKHLEWEHQIYRDGKCRTCDRPEEYGMELHLDANEVKEGNCDLKLRKEMKAFSKFLDMKNGSTFTTLKLADLKVMEN